MESDISLALLNGGRVAELEGSASRRLTLVRVNTARLETPTLPVISSCDGVAQLVPRWASDEAR